MWQIIKENRFSKSKDEIIEEHETKEQAKYFVDIYNQYNNKWEFFRYVIEEIKQL